MFSVNELRDAILAARFETSNFGEVPKPDTLYIPPNHVKALRLEANIVIGARGVGKSFWTGALSSPSLRELLGTTVRELDRAEVRVGFSVKEAIEDYPNADGFAQMLKAGIDAYDIWRAIIVRWLAASVGEDIPVERWFDTVNWIRENPENVARLIRRAHHQFDQDDRFGLIVFDALDRTSDNWDAMDLIARGLLKAALWLKSYPRLHAKVFMREDQLDRTVTNFADASKLLATKAELTWERHDLHGMLWQRLVNAPGSNGGLIRALCSAITGERLSAGSQGTYLLPDALKRESPTQRRLFEALAGEWMGKDPRRGVPYTWAVGHLADGRGQTSPRSFLAAIHQAADDSRQRYPDHRFALHYESIKRGIQEASQIRVREMAEDYPWVREFLGTLRGLNVPCAYDLIRDRWRDAFPQGPASARTQRLPAQHADLGWEGVRDDCIRLGVLEMKRDRRMDMPDLYRVGFGLGRKGGVKPKN